jgi:general secretion pathway protein M
MKFNVKFNEIYTNLVTRFQNNEQLNRIKKESLDRWQQLSLRERILLAGSSVFFILLIFYLMIWEPLTNAADRYRQDVITNKMLIAQIEQAGPEINALRSQVKSAQIKDQAELLSVVERDVKKSRVQAAISEIGLGQENTVRLRFDDVPFDELMSWLIELQQKKGIVVHSFTLEKLPEIGHVRVQLTVNAV